MSELTQIFIIVKKKKFTRTVPFGQLTESQCICYERQENPSSRSLSREHSLLNLLPFR